MTLTDFLLARIAEDEAWAPPPPDRALAECEAKRRIVERCDAVGPLMPADHLAQGVIRTLAAVYADHPDYREEWKP